MKKLYVRAALLSTASRGANAVAEVCGSREILQLTVRCLSIVNVKQRSVLSH